MRYRKTFKLFKTKGEAEIFINNNLKRKKYTFLPYETSDGSANYIIWYFE